MQNARRVTSSVVFGQCDGRLGPDVLEEVKNRAVRAKEKELTKKQNKKKREVNLLKRVRAALKQFKAKNEKIEALSNEHIKSLCQWKKGPKDKGLTGLNKKELIERYNAMKNNTHDSLFL